MDTMKKLYYIILGLLVGLVACQENDKTDFDSNGAVYFQVNPSSWSDTRDSIVYSFAGKDGDSQTLNVQVNLMGETVNYERHVRVVVNSGKTTAQAGIHYAALEEEYILPAEAFSMNIPVVLYNKDPRLEEEAFQLVLDLEPSDDLELGLTARTTVRVIISNVLTRPYYWEDMYMDGIFGPYSRVKHEYCIRKLGRDFPQDSDEYRTNYGIWKAYGKYMDNFFYENYPILDENGLAIEPWL